MAAGLYGGERIICRRRRRGGDDEERRAPAAIWVAVDKYLPTLKKGIVNLNPFCVSPAR